MAYGRAFFLGQPSTDLFRAPVLPKQLLHTCPGRFRYPRSVPLFLAVLRQPVGLFGTVAFQSLVPPQFPADGRGAAPQNLSDFFLAVTRFPQRIDLVSFISGKLRVASHRAPLSWWIELILLCHIMSCVRGAMWLSLTHCFIKVFYDDLAKFPLPPWKRPFSGSQITSTLILSHFRNFCHLAPAASVAHSTAISVDYSRHLVGACYA